MSKTVENMLAQNLVGCTDSGDTGVTPLHTMNSKQARIEQELQSLVKKYGTTFGTKIWDRQTDKQTDGQTGPDIELLCN